MAREDEQWRWRGRAGAGHTRDRRSQSLELEPNRRDRLESNVGEALGKARGLVRELACREIEYGAVGLSEHADEGQVVRRKAQELQPKQQ